MTSSYSIYNVSSFPNTGLGEILSAPRQLPMDFAEAPPKTELAMQRTIGDLGIDVFRTLHEFVVYRSGRTKEVEFSHYIEKRIFPAYYCRPQGVLLLKTNKDIATGAMKQLVRVEGIVGKRPKIVLDSIKPYIGRFKGVWFKVDDSADVNAQALFGYSVDKDLRFTRAIEEGAMYYIRFDYNFSGEMVSIGISSDSNVVIYADNLDEYLELQLVLEVKRTLIDRAQPEMD